MGMPISVEIADSSTAHEALDKVFVYFKNVDQRFSTYKEDSEITWINQGRLAEKDWSEDIKTVFALAEQTKKETYGYFNIQQPDGRYDPSGIVKGWAIYHAAKILDGEGYKNFYIDAGGDIETRGKNSEGKYWSVGIKNPFNEQEITKVVYVSGEGVATSGTYIRGEHIYNPVEKITIRDIVSLTVIGPNIFEADRFATGAFAMGRKGIDFIEKLGGFEGYMIDKNGLATLTSGFETYTKPRA